MTSIYKNLNLGSATGAMPLSSTTGLPGMQWSSPNLVSQPAQMQVPMNMTLGNAATSMGPYKLTLPDGDVAQKGNLTGWDKFNIGLSALGTVGGLYLSNEQLGLSKDMHNWNKGVTSANLENQASLTNLGLRERQVRRGLEQGLTSDQAASAADQYIKEYGVRGKV